MTNAEVKVDLHVHSSHSHKTYSWFMQKAGAAECYTSPRQVYDLATQRGMDLVTICDHDEIAGALELCALGPNTFVSEEVSARFPEDGCVMHTMVLGITEAQHREIQRLRRNIYELVPYLVDQGIEYFLCHPLSPVNRRLEASHLKRSLLMYRSLELRNGTRDEAHEQALVRILAGLTPDRLARWAEEFPQTPWVNRAARFAFVGGSDDHAALSIARAYTRFEGERSLAGLLAALKERRVAPGGDAARPEVLSHNVYGVVAAHLSHTGQVPSLALGGAPGKSPALAKMLERYASLLGDAATSVDFSSLPGRGHTDETQRQLHAALEKVLVGSSRISVGGLQDAVLSMQPAEAAEQVGEVVKALFFSVPAILGQRAFALDRRHARTFGDQLATEITRRDASPRVAIVSDTVDETNGVALGLRRLVAEARAQGADVHLVGLGDGDRLEVDADGIVRVPAVLRHRLQDYPQIPFGLPHFPSLLDYLVRNDIDLVQCSTPGPMGLAALAAGRLAGIGVIGQYHTDLPEYIARITGDPVLTDMFAAGVGWFYGALDRVLAPSGMSRDRLLELGVPAEKVRLVPRGIDLQLFSPRRRQEHAFDRFGLNGEPKVLYVGRLSREKGLDALVDGFNALGDELASAKLLLVGAGPYKDSLAQRGPADRVIFAGEHQGETLASLYASSDVFVLPSETETFGNAVVEAQAAGVPVIVANRGAACENVVHGVTGLVVDARDPAAIRDAIRHLLTRPGLRRKMAEAAAQFARRYDLRAAAKETCEIYRSVLAELRSPAGSPSRSPTRSSKAAPSAA